MRFFASAALSNDLKLLFVGSTGADIIIFRQDLRVLRTLIPACSGGVRSLLVLPNDDLMCGGGDGVLKVLRGDGDMTWSLVQQVSLALSGSIDSLQLSSNLTEVIIGCSEGTVYRCLYSDITSCQKVSESHTHAVTAIAFRPSSVAGGGRDSNSVIFASGTSSGDVRVWDLTDYACQAVLPRLPRAGAVHCLLLPALPGTGTWLVSGWGDGGIRCHDMGGGSEAHFGQPQPQNGAGAAPLQRQLWCLPDAHRGGVLSVQICASDSLQYLLSGGVDGTVRVWRLTNRELLFQFASGKGAIAQVLVDLVHSHMIHSVSSDCTVQSYDLKKAKAVLCHAPHQKIGAFTGIAQRKDSELELISCDTAGRLMHWDCDAREPVQMFVDLGLDMDMGLHVHVAAGGSTPKSKPNPIRCCQISPSGRYLAFAGDDSVLKIMNVASNAVVAVGINAHSAAVHSLFWTPDEKQIMTGGNDACLCVWNFYL